jgi:DNA topoisomerase-1
MSSKKPQAEKTLVIVESPNKVKTISSILKKAGYDNITVMASVGHIMALGNGGPAFNSGIYPKQKFKMNLAVAEDKKKVVSDLTTHAKNADKIIIMTDGDREGEIIAWSLLKFCKLPQEKCYRAITHEITPKALVEAIEHPIGFNDNLVNAGLTRMMIDKLIGYGLSPLGKKYIGAKSIGRCQSVGLKLVSDRETEIANFIPEVYFNLHLNFVKDTIAYKAKYVGYNEEKIDKFNKQVDVEAVIANCKNSPFTIESIDKIEHQESPKAPFCTATFQQEAANKLGLRVKDAMSCAQKLFEGVNVNGEHKGLITYMRTDSTEIAYEFLPELKQFVVDNYGSDKYIGPKKSKKKATDQDGHEALRVSDPSITPDILATYINNNLLLKVYKLIWQRTVSSVMPNAVFAETVYTINNNGHKFILSEKELLMAGYRAVYEFEDNQPASAKASFTIGERLEQAELEPVKKFTQPKARYTEASLVKELQQREIGRPSTYASIVETILSPTRGYAKLEEKHIVPTDRGMQLAEYCNRSFPTLINTNYTKEMEESLDKIAAGKTMWLDYMEIFYKNLVEIIEATSETGIAPEMPEKVCPNCGSPMVVRRSRFGRLFYGCSTYPKCNGIVGID